MPLTERQRHLKGKGAQLYVDSIHKKNSKPAPELYEYLNFRKSAGFAQTYTGSIAQAVTKFLEFIGQNTPISEITSADLDNFVEFLRRHKYATASIQLYATHVQGFLKYMRDTGRIAVLPRRLKPIRMTEEEAMEEPQLLTADDIIAIRQASALPPPPSQLLWRAVRQKLVIELLISTGMRKSELPSIVVSNIDLGGRRVKIYGRKNSFTRRAKGKSGWRVVPLTGFAVKFIKEWLAVRPEETDDLLPGFLPRDADYIVKKVCVKAGLLREGSTNSSWVGPHKFRHYFATTLYEKGVDLSVIADQMGDEISTLKRYIHSDREHDMQAISDLLG